MILRLLLLPLLGMLGCRSGSETGFSPEATDARRVPIMVKDDAYDPSEVRALPGETVHLVFTRYSKMDCADRVRVQGKEVVLPFGRPAVVAVKTPASGRVPWACSDRRLTGAVQVSSERPDPGLEHPLLTTPLPLEHAAALLGKPAAEWRVNRWEGTRPLTLSDLKGRVVVVRFYMDECPFCRATLPAIDRIARELEGEPVTFVGLFHSKPKGTESDWGTAVRTARTWGAHFPLGYDSMWKTLESWYGDFLGRAPTSVTFVINHEGNFEMIHPGPVYHPATHPDHARCNQDFEAVRRGIIAAMARAKEAGR